MKTLTIVMTLFCLGMNLAHAGDPTKKSDSENPTPKKEAATGGWDFEDSKANGILKTLADAVYTATNSQDGCELRFLGDMLSICAQSLDNDPDAKLSDNAVAPELTRPQHECLVAGIKNLDPSKVAKSKALAWIQKAFKTDL